MILVQRKAIPSLLVAILFIAAAARIPALTLPFSGDEIVDEMIATGQAFLFFKRIEHNKILPIEKIKRFFTFPPNASEKLTLAAVTFNSMHPPFYYLLYRNILQIVGNNEPVLRTLAIITSLGSIFLLFLIGGKTGDKSIGLLAALFLALSSYGIRYSSVLRPYPFAMFISLLAVLITLRLSKPQSPTFDKTIFFLFFGINLIGLYTLYHFIFVFIFQLTYLILDNATNKKKLLWLCSAVIFIVLLYAPWTPQFIFQSQKLVSYDFPFKGATASVTFLDNLASRFHLNFTQYLPTPLVVPINMFVNIGLLMGLYHLWKGRAGRIILFTIITYFIVIYAADKLLHTRTVLILRAYFFTMPLLFLLLSIGLRHLPSRFYANIIVPAVCCGALVWNFSFVYPYGTNAHDGPILLKELHNEITRVAKDTPKTLVLINTHQKRYYFSLFSAVKVPVDVKLLHAYDLPFDLTKLTDIGDYDRIMLIYWHVSYSPKDNLLPAKIELLKNYLFSSGFKLTKTHIFSLPPKKSAYYIFENCNKLSTNNE